MSTHLWVRGLLQERGWEAEGELEPFCLPHSGTHHTCLPLRPPRLAPITSPAGGPPQTPPTHVPPILAWPAPPPPPAPLASPAGGPSQLTLSCPLPCLLLPPATSSFLQVVPHSLRHFMCAFPPACHNSPCPSPLLRILSSLPVTTPTLPPHLSCRWSPTASATRSIHLNACAFL